MARPRKWTKVTYLLSDNLNRELALAAQRRKLKKSQFVRRLLRAALAAYQRGWLRLPESDEDDKPVED